MAEPKVTRPWMPGYGVPPSLEGATPWSWAEDKLRSSRNYFVATIRPDGRPHLMPLWGLWHLDRFCFATAITSVKSRNLLADPRMAVTIEDGHHSVTVEGTARVTPLDEVPGFLDAYGDKYGHENNAVIGDGPIWTMTPSVAFVFREDETFSTSATRYVF